VESWKTTINTPGLTWTDALQWGHDSGVVEDVGMPTGKASQVEVLPKLCVHSDFICLINPYVLGGNSGEIDFVAIVVASALGLPDGFSMVECEIHTALPRPGSRVPLEDAVKNGRSNIESTLRSVCPRATALGLHFWPNLIERILVWALEPRRAGGHAGRSR
jgi:hypothetical protein